MFEIVVRGYLPLPQCCGKLIICTWVKIRISPFQDSAFYSILYQRVRDFIWTWKSGEDLLNLYNLFHIFADNIQSADLSKNVWNLCFFFLSIYWISLKCLCNVISGWMILFSLKSKVITQPRVTLKSQKKIFKSNWNSKLVTYWCNKI